MGASFYYEAGDDKFRQLQAKHRGQPLVRKQLFVERVLERTSPMFKGWSGGVLVAESYHDFFAEVWKRFNDSLRHEGSPWHAKIVSWLEHYAAGTVPTRANGASKLIHPWRAQRLQQSVARMLLEERYGESVVQTLATSETRAAARLYRALLGGVIEVYDYVPWASHLVRRFCTMQPHRVAAKRRREEDDRAVLTIAARRVERVRVPPSGGEVLSPSLARPPGPVQ